MTLGLDSVMVLGEELTPPEGYSAEALLAATYTLDPVMALGLPLALIRRGRFAGDAVEAADPYAVMTAIRRFSRRYRVFHDATGLHTVPSAQRRLLNLLGEVIVPVALPATGLRATFHPKFVLVHFGSIEPTAPDVLRLVCMSRNLTGDAALDACCVLEGVVGANPLEEGSSRRLGVALERLLDWSVRQPPTEDARTLVRDLARLVRRTAWRVPEGFRNVEVWPLGFEQRRFDPAARQLGDRRALVMSPFIDNTRLKQLAGESADSVLISTTEALAAIPAATRRRFAVKTVDPLRAPGDGLHAKLYVLEGPRSRRWILGSANATAAAVTRNAELLIELEAGRSGPGIDSLLAEDDGIGSILIAEDPPMEDEQLAPVAQITIAEELFGELATRHLVGRVSVDERATYRVEVTLEPPVDLPGAQVDVAFSDQRWEQLRTDRDPGAELRYVARRDLSRFLRVRVSADGDSVERLLMVELEGIEEGDLAEEAITSLIREDDTLDPLEYVRRLLTGEDGGSLGLSFDDDDDRDGDDDDGGGEPDASGAAGAQRARSTLPMLEAMLAALEQGDRGRGAALLADVASAVEGFKDVLPAEFLDVWSVIDATRSGTR
jgi:hypothetical protein